MLLLSILGVVAWIVISVPVALLVGGAFNLEEGDVTPSAAPGEVSWADTTDELVRAG